MPEQSLTHTLREHDPVLHIHRHSPSHGPVMDHIRLRTRRESPFQVPVALLKKHSLGSRHAVPASYVAIPLFRPFWTVLMPRECILNLRLDIGPFQCSSGCSNLHPDSPPLRVPGIDKDRMGAHSSLHSRRYTASANPTCATYIRSAILQASTRIWSHRSGRSGLSVITYSSSRC